MPLSNPSAKIRSLVPGVTLGVNVCVGDSVRVGVIVGDGVNVIVGGCGVALCVTVGVIGVFVRVGVFVCAPLGVRVGVWDAVPGRDVDVFVLLGAIVGVKVAVCVGVSVNDGVKVGVGILPSNSYAPISQ